MSLVRIYDLYENGHNLDVYLYPSLFYLLNYPPDYAHSMIQNLCYRSKDHGETHGPCVLL